MTLKLGTRGSDLAMTQSRWVAGQLREAGVDTELVVISTSGDRSTAPTFGAIGPQGVFVREIEEALADRRIDIAVHSFKDLPTASPAGLIIGAVPARRDPADWLFVPANSRTRRPGASAATAGTPATSAPAQSEGLAVLASLPPGSRIGTASARRQVWIRHLRPDCELVSLRGNVPTRLKRLADGDYDAILLAGAGIERLTEASDVLDAVLGEVERYRLDPHSFVPAPAQGALAVQCREADDDIRTALAHIDDRESHLAVDLERRALALAEGGCDSAFGAYATVDAGDIALQVMAERNGRIAQAAIAGDPDTLDHLAMQALDSAAGEVP